MRLNPFNPSSIRVRDQRGGGGGMGGTMVTATASGSGIGGSIAGRKAKIAARIAAWAATLKIPAKSFDRSDRRGLDPFGPPISPKCCAIVIPTPSGPPPICLSREKNSERAE